MALFVLNFFLRKKKLEKKAFYRDYKRNSLLRRSDSLLLAFEKVFVLIQRYATNNKPSESCLSPQRASSFQTRFFWFVFLSMKKMNVHSFATTKGRLKLCFKFKDLSSYFPSKSLFNNSISFGVRFVASLAYMIFPLPTAPKMMS